jgi:neutral ceramidase
MAGQLVTSHVISKLAKTYGTLYTEQNVAISGIHTHSTPGGFLEYVLYDIPSKGFVRQSFDALVEGIVKSIERAHSSLQPGSVLVNTGELLDASVNRSPTAYDNNPEEERARYAHNVDKTMILLRVISEAGKEIGVLNWFAGEPSSPFYFL